METDHFLSRERLAGYDPDCLQRGVVVLVGGGALGNNVAQNLSLSGVGELWVIDFDTIDPSNFTRSPCFPRTAVFGTKPRSKARTLAEAVLALSHAAAPVVRYAPKRLEALGLGAFQGASVIVSAVDSFRARARLADIARLLGVPLVEGGFNGSRGQVSVYTNATAGGPCYRCLNPATEGGISCTLYARGVTAEGRTPATQTIAALTAAYVTEATIKLLHDCGSPLGNKMVTFDVAAGGGTVMTLTRDPECAGVHRLVGEPNPVEVSASEPATNLFEVVASSDELELVLPFEYLVQAPCAHCGARVHVAKPEWQVLAPPACTACSEPVEGAAPAPLMVVSRIGRGDQLARRPLRKLGITAMDIVELVNRATGTSRWFQLRGSLEDLYFTKSRAPHAQAFTDSADFLPRS